MAKHLGVMPVGDAEKQKHHDTCHQETKLLEVFRFKHVKNRSRELNNSSGKLQLFGTLEGMKLWITAHFMPLGICFPLYSLKKKKKVVGSLCILRLNILSRDESSFED